MEGSNLSTVSNDDFRKLLMTPRRQDNAEEPTTTKATAVFAKPTVSASTARSTSGEGDGPQSRVLGAKRRVMGGMTPRTLGGAKRPAVKVGADAGAAASAKAAKRKQHTSEWWTKKKAAEEKAKKYRDRAKERRAGKTDDDKSDLINIKKEMAKNVLEGTLTADEAAAQATKESQFLGGDMEHTHLVRGLDYALLEKRRREINTRANEHPAGEDDAKEENLEFKSYKAKRIYEAATTKRRPDEITPNQNFLPGRLVFNFCTGRRQHNDDDDDDSEHESDIPTTVVRSKAEVAANFATEAISTHSDHDIVVEKLVQILSYIRSGRGGGVGQAPGGGEKPKKRKKKVKTAVEQTDTADVDIFAGAGSYEATAAANTAAKIRAPATPFVGEAEMDLEDDEAGPALPNPDANWGYSEAENAGPWRPPNDEGAGYPEAPPAYPEPPVAPPMPQKTKPVEPDYSETSKDELAYIAKKEKRKGPLKMSLAEDSYAEYYPDGQTGYDDEMALSDDDDVGAKKYFNLNDTEAIAEREKFDEKRLDKDFHRISNIIKKRKEGGKQGSMLNETASKRPKHF